MGQILLDDKIINYEINYKKIKNIYYRYIDNVLVISAPRFRNEKEIINIITKDKNRLLKFINKSSIKSRKIDLNNLDYINVLGIRHDIVVSDKLEIKDKTIYIPNKNKTKEILTILFNVINQYCTEKTNTFFDLIYGNKIKPNIKYKLVKTYKGQYNRKNHEITYNIALAMHNPMLIDYVIIHELCHIKHFNHSVEFHNMLERYCPNHKYLQRKLEKEWINLC